MMKSSSVFIPLEMHLIRQHRLEMELAYLGVEDEEFVSLAVVGEQTKKKTAATDDLGVRRRASTDEHLTHRPPICCAFCCCVRLEVCRGLCRLACGVCQHPLFVALFRDATDPRFWIRFAMFKVVGIVLSVINIITNFDFGVDVALFLLIGSSMMNLICLTITRHLLKEALRTEHGAAAFAALQYCACSIQTYFCWPCRVLIQCLASFVTCVSYILCCCSNGSHEEEKKLETRVVSMSSEYKILRGEEEEEEKQNDEEEEEQEEDLTNLLSKTDLSGNRKRRLGIKMPRPLLPPSTREASMRLYEWIRLKLRQFDNSKVFRESVMRVWYKRERYEIWLNARVDAWLLEHSGALDDVSSTRTHGRTRSVIEYEKNRSLAVAEVRWKLRELNFSHLQQRVVGRTLWVMVLQFVGGIMQNAGAVLILYQECDCTCKNFQWTVAAQCYWGLLSVSLTLGSCFDSAIRYVSNRCILVAINKTLEVVICLGFSILQFIYLTLIFIRVFHNNDDDPQCHSEHEVKRYFGLQLFAALAAFVCMVFIVLEKVYMKYFCSTIPTHIWSLGLDLQSSDGLPDVHNNGCWNSPF